MYWTKAMMGISDYLKSKAELVEKSLDTLIPEKDVPYNQLYRAARYALLGGGKRLRPILTLATAEALAGSYENAILPACALEMVHTYSLIHDDLPCMDDDDFRRGKPSLHKAFPEGQAVLTGDFLLTFAFEVITQAPNLDADQRLQLITLLAKNSGGDCMIGGQVMDLEAEGKAISLDSLKDIHQRKTGAMITASIEFGAIIAKAPETERKQLRSFGDKIGLAFQVVDDLLDVTASKEKHGKEISSDIANHKTTYVTLKGIDESKRIASLLLNESIGHLKNIEKNTIILEQLAHHLINRSF